MNLREELRAMFQKTRYEPLMDTKKELTTQCFDEDMINKILEKYILIPKDRARIVKSSNTIYNVVCNFTNYKGLGNEPRCKLDNKICNKKYCKISKIIIVEE